jgi:phenylacetate-CoA ligase
MRVPDIEKAKPSDIEKYQGNRLRELIEYLSHHSPYYTQLFKTNHISPGKIKEISDLQSIPTTTKQDLQHHEDQFRCVSSELFIDYITTSGTLGDPVTFALTEKDLNRLAYNEALSFSCTGGSSKSIYQLMTTLDRRFMAGLAYFLGIRMLGGAVVRVGNGIPLLQWDSIRRINPDSIIAVPSFILKIIDFAEANGIDYRQTSVQSAICIGEPLRNQDFSLNILGNRIIEKWQLKLFSTYASTEMATSFTECSYGKGGHHHPELIITEFLDDSNNQVLPGEPGEVTVSTLGIEGMPLLRFKTGDVCTYFTEPCECGRTTFRIGPVIGRKNQMIKYKGTTIYPPAIYDVLDDLGYVTGYIVEVYTNQIGTDEIRIHLSVSGETGGREKEIKDHFRAKLRVAPEVLFCEQTLLDKMIYTENSRKPIRFIDKRQIPYS